MQKHHEAKLCLAEAFARLAQTMPPERVTVAMVADAVGKHRKTFYYHFSDKEQLVIWLFRYDLAKTLIERFPEEMLICEPDEKDSPFSGFPFYARNLKGPGRIYNAPFFSAFAHSIERRRAYYRRIFQTRGPGTLDYYLHQLYCPVIRQDILLLIDYEASLYNPLIAEGVREKITANASIDFLAEFYTGAFLARIVERLNYAPSRRTTRQIIPFENVVHDSLAALIRQEADKAAREMRGQGPDGI